MPKKRSKISLYSNKGKEPTQNSQLHRYTFKAHVRIIKQLLPHKKG